VEQRMRARLVALLALLAPLAEPPVVAGVAERPAVAGAAAMAPRWIRGACSSELQAQRYR